MRRIGILGTFLGMAALWCQGAVPEEAFRYPPKESHPETWFHFIGGNVAAKGVTADLEAIAGAGISGVQLFHGQFGGPWPGVTPQVACLSETWDGMVGHVANECKRLGLRFTMQNCPGWAMSGGPWITPEHAMRHLVWNRTDVEGGKSVRIRLPQPGGKEEWRDYRDITVLAFPTPDGDWSRSLTPTSVTADQPGDWDAWIKGKAVSLPGYATTTLTITFAEPVTIRTVEFPSINGMDHGWCYQPDTTIRFGTDGKVLLERTLPAANWQDDRPVTMACPETTAKQFTLSITCKHAFKLNRVHFFSSARKDDWEAEAAWTLRRLMHNPPTKQSPSAWVSSALIKNVADCMQGDGGFVWDAPEGKWSIIRVGHVNTGAKNGPAPKEGTGFECDKLSTDGADIQFDNYIGRLSKSGGAVHGKLDNMLMDSWECKRQTWTPGLDKVFAERKGYDLFTWLPAVFGYVVDDPEETSRFLNDWRGLLGDLVAENFYGRMAKRCHENGMTISFETAFGDVLPGDIMKYYKYADLPMCEFWQPRQDNYVGSFNFKPIKPTVSAARLYGKKGVGAEAFTSFSLTWDEKLRDLKHVANLHLAGGVTHLIFHTYTHNPRTDWLPPGTSFGSGIGTPFLRGQTWWPFMPAFTAYLSRCQVMLETGVPVSDVLWYLGDEWDHKPDEDAPFPVGYKYDYCNPDAFLTRVSVNRQGLWQTPDGITYRVLWLPACRRMLPETLEHLLAQLQKGGVAVMPALPECLATRSGGDKALFRFLRAREVLKKGEPYEGLKDVFRIGEGRLYLGRPLQSVLHSESVAADLVGSELLWNHRKSDTDEWYFVAPARERVGFCGTAGFRARGAVEIWHPDTGRSEPASVVSYANDYTWVSLSLAPHEGCFVVFRKPEQARPDAIVRVSREDVTLMEASSRFMRHPPTYGTKVVEARYGDLTQDGKWSDVSKQLQDALDRSMAEVRISNAWAGGDPAYRTVKTFSAKIRLPDGEEVALSAKEGGAVSLPARSSSDAALPCEPVRGQIAVWTNGTYTITRADGKTTDHVVEKATRLHLRGTWNVRYPEGWGMLPYTRMQTLVPWKDVNGTLEGRAFSGTVEYSIDFIVNQLDPDSLVMLDLGRVESLARVEVNGQAFPDLWSYPYRVEVTRAVKPGVNHLKLQVTDTWFNRLVFDAGRPENERRTWTINGPSKDAALRESGCLGPVYVYHGRLIR